jgi:CheY-like chemotaxis protein
MGLNCLVVDDDSFMQTLLNIILTQDEHHVLTAGNATEAMHILDHQKVDLITCDLIMPGMDGITFLQQLKSNPRFETIPVILITAGGGHIDQAEAKNQGAAALVEKPFTMQDLRQVISKVLNSGFQEFPSRAV